MNTINYLWRLLATGICFSVFGIGSIVLTVCVFPLVSLVMTEKNKKEKTARLLVRKSFRGFTWLMSILGVIDFSVSSAEKILAQQKGKIIIANHPTLIDVVVLVSIVPHAVCIVKKQLWSNFFLKGVVQSSGYIKNDGDVDNLMSSCQKALTQGYSIVIFPEGTRTVPGQQMSLQRGASNIALRCKADLVPVTIRCQPTTLSKGEPWYNIPPKKIAFSLKVGNTMNVNDYFEKNGSMAVRARMLTENIKAYYQRELASYG